MTSQLRKYKKVKYLGKGSYGAAILVELKSNPSQTFVIKEIVIGHLKPAEQQAAKNEAEVLHQMAHSNITMYIESFVENSKLYIVMEHADGGDLSSAIQKRRTESKHYAEDEVMRIFVQICLALKHVHSANILHRDLKSQNIFLTLTGIVKLGDFGIAKVLDTTDDQARTQIGTPYYLSPEICESKPYGRMSDIWSLGVLLYEIIALEMPFQATSLPALVHKICSSEPNYSKLESKYSPILLLLTKHTLHKQPDKRPTIQQIVKTDFIKGHISRLLSYTLKAGNGGVSSAAEPIPQTQIGKSIDVEEVEKHLEKVINQQREQPKRSGHEDNLRDAEIEKQKQFNREEESRKMKKFQQDQINKKKQSVADAESDVVVKPAPPFTRQSSQQEIDEKDKPPQQQRQEVADRNKYPNESEVTYRAQQDNSKLNNMRANAAAAVPTNNMEIQSKRYVSGNYHQHNNGNIISGNYNQNNNGNGNVNRAPNASSNVITGGSQYESAARREFFANRAAAQAVKLRVEANERGGNILLGGNVVSTPANDNHLAVVTSNNHHNNNQRRHSNDGGIAPPFAVEAPTAEYNPEARIAQLRAQRDRDKERENAQKELEIKQAMEQNRLERRRMAEAASRKAPVAFEIDISGVGGSSSNTHHHQNDAKRGASSVSSDADSFMPPIAINSRQSFEPPKKHWGSSSSSDSKPTQERNNYNAPAKLPAVVDADINDDDTVKADHFNSPVNNSVTSKKKGWGPPVELKIARGIVARPSMHDDNTPPRSFTFNNEKDKPSASQSVEAAEGGGVYQKEDGGDDDNNNDYVDDADVMRRLEIKRMSQIDARNRAKEVMKKLREMKKRDSEVGHGAASGKGGSKKQPRIEGSAINQHLQPKPSVRPHREEKAFALQRLGDVLQQVEAATESVQKALHMAAPAPNKFNRNVGDEKASAAESKFAGNRFEDIVSEDKPRERRGSDSSKALEKVQEGAREDNSTGGGEEDDLQSTIETWLIKQKRGVTSRRKRWHEPDNDRFSLMDDRGRNNISNSSIDPSGGISPRNYKGAYFPKDQIAEELDGMVGNAAAKEVEDEEFDMDPFDDNESEVEVEDEVDGAIRTSQEDRNRGVFMGNDVEVVGLQCMLAKALMGDDDDDEVEEEADGKDSKDG